MDADHPLLVTIRAIILIGVAPVLLVIALFLICWFCVVWVGALLLDVLFIPIYFLQDVVWPDPFRLVEGIAGEPARFGWFYFIRLCRRARKDEQYSINVWRKIGDFLAHGL